ncbi:MAG: hypothetical protein F4W95_04895 [Chloroflexi bacterium]|nr:hypothetical protein [Chloroflexota bacterium]MYD47807.1 hypothetical protein [Chloroflexota bacterium]
MIKLNITLPSGAQVSLESDDKDFVREVLHSTMPHLNGAAPPPAPAPAGVPAEPAAHSNGSPSIGHGSVGADAPQPGNGHHPPLEQPAGEPASVQQAAVAPVSAPPAPAHRLADPEPAATAVSQTASTPAPSPSVAPSTPDEHEYIAFCQRVNPLGDMRRVVVAAEAADRHLTVRSVDPDELSRLFTLAGWPIPHSFVQTLRNAARSKFRWMERIPGQLGHYRVTNAGRKIVLGETAVSSAGTSDSED